ncbi:4838_t:CDS:2 [Acaulospora colombiana]|uniref:4838_t:CDS:1 n=1 Tax=Acaulospora colombiana TaxID=27376 RepID=A0ACA9NNI3_9GLOM|nr:4838_t:CDS:2 [Acaulospora colombiana]
MPNQHANDKRTGRGGAAPSVFDFVESGVKDPFNRKELYHNFGKFPLLSWMLQPYAAFADDTPTIFLVLPIHHHPYEPSAHAGCSFHCAASPTPLVDPSSTCTLAQEWLHSKLLYVSPTPLPLYPSARPHSVYDGVRLHSQSYRGWNPASE